MTQSPPSALAAIGFWDGRPDQDLRVAMGAAIRQPIAENRQLRPSELR